MNRYRFQWLSGGAIFLLLFFRGISLCAQNFNALSKEFNTHYDDGRYAQAEQVARRGLRLAEQRTNNSEVALWSNRLGLALSELERFAEAEPLYQQALRIWEKTFGTNHRDVAAALNNLANLYQSQGKYDQAEPLLQRALNIREKALGPEHVDVAAASHNSGDLYMMQGKYSEAEPLLQRALRIKEKLAAHSMWMSLLPRATCIHSDSGWRASHPPGGRILLF